MKLNKNNKKNKKKAGVVLTGAALLAIIAGTFAWTSYTEWVKNHMQSSGIEEGKVSIVEIFPDPIIKPDMTKKVSISNASSVDVFVRVSFEEMLHRLDDNAEGKGYKTLDTADFPVVINAVDYKSSGVGEKSAAGWEDISNLLTINDAVVPIAENKEGSNPGKDGYKLYKKDDSYALIYVEKMSKKAGVTTHYWPASMEFDLTQETIPTYTGDYTKDDEAQIARKVTGHAIKKPSGKINFTENTGADTDLQYFGYGKGLKDMVEKDWAGENVNVTTSAITPQPANKFNVSATDEKVTFGMGNVSNDATISNAKDWWYNDKDGFFYYTKALKANSTTSNTVLESVHFPTTPDGKLENSFKVASYNLFVGMEAIPAYQSALQATYDGQQIGSVGDATSNGSGWGLVPGSSNGVYEYFANIAVPE